MSEYKTIYESVQFLIMIWDHADSGAPYSTRDFKQLQTQILPIVDIACRTGAFMQLSHREDVYFERFETVEAASIIDILRTVTSEEETFNAATMQLQLKGLI